MGDTVKACQQGPARASRMVASGMAVGAGDTSTGTRTSDPETQDGGPAPATAPTVMGRPGAATARGESDAALVTREATRYEMVAEHGRGGLGRVLRARDRELGRTVAIKELLRRGRSAELRFLREAMITARLEHPAIVPVHEAGRWPDGTPFYSMKLVAGRPLRDLVEDAASADDPLAARLALVPHVVAVADAIAYAHARRIVHRDLKPSNVIVGDYGETVVIDWGLAKDLSAGEREDVADPYRAPAMPDVTEAGAVMGTPAFMAPEQARGEAGDERADVYALGAMLYAVLAGQSPYQGTRSTDIVRAVVDGPPAPLAELAPGAPADLIAVTAAAMAREPAQRLASAKLLADELRRFLRGQQVESHRYSAAEKALRWMRRHRELSAAVAVGAAMLAAVGAAAVSRIVDERDAADRERRRAESALADARAQREALVLNHARVDAERDPTAALAWLAAYRGADDAKSQELAAIAVGRGAATFSRNRGGFRIGEAAVLSFDPPHVVTVGPDRTVRSWRAGRPGPTVVASTIGTATSLTLATSPRGGAAFAQDGHVVVVDADGNARPLFALADVQSIDFSADGQRVIAAGRGGEIVVAVNGAERRVRLPDSAGRLHRALASDDGTAIAVCDERGALWYVVIGGRWRSLGPCSLALTGALAFSRNGDRLVALLADGIAIHELAHPSAPRRLRFPTPAAVFVLADGHVVVGGVDGSLRDLAVGAATVDLAGADAAVLRLAEAADGRLAVGYADGTVRVYDRRTGHIERIAGFRSQITTLQWSPDSRALFVADHDEVRFAPVPTGRRWAVPDGNFHTVYDAAGRWLALDSQSGDLAIVDRTTDEVRTLAGHRGTAFGLLFVDAGLVSAGHDGTVRLWDPATGAVRMIRERGGTIRSLAGAGRGDVVTADADGRLQAIDVRSGVATLLPTTRAPRRVAVSPDGARIVVVGEKGHVDVIATGAASASTVVVHQPIDAAVRYSPRGSFFATAGRGGRIEVRDREGARLHVGQYGARCVTLEISSRDEIAAACGPLVVRLVRDGDTWRASWRELESYIYSLAFAPDGGRLAIGTVAGTVYVLDVATDALAARHLGSGLVTAVAFSPDGDEIAATASLTVLHAISVADLAFAPRSAASRAAWLAGRRDDDLRLVPGGGP
jgi:WD40 repeat protein/tRNA A-37 threonylcarbamoyl transferase component Bud32